MKDIQLSATQHTILAAAAEREDGSVFPLTTELKGGAVGIMLRSLLKRGLVEGEGESLRITSAGYEALGTETDEAPPALTASKQPMPRRWTPPQTRTRP